MVNTMKNIRMKGFIDPITIGFILAISSTATILTLDANTKSEQHAQVSNSNVVVAAQVKEQ